MNQSSATVLNWWQIYLPWVSARSGRARIVPALIRADIKPLDQGLVHLALICYPEKSMNIRQSIFRQEIPPPR
jgi:hypothetical protein